jgi:uncharacterized protein YacL
VRWWNRAAALLVLAVPAAAVVLLAPARRVESSPLARIGIGLAVMAGALLLYLAARRLRTSSVVGASIGLALGLLCASLLASVLGPGHDTLRRLVALGLGWLGLVLGATRGPGFRLEALVSRLRREPSGPAPKILDTSVIIDGRIADLAETGLLEGTLLVPAFVLRELQRIADSRDAVRRARGRKGLEVLERMRTSPSVNVQLGEDDIPGIAEVDAKLVELAVQTGGAILTNDANLGKVAGLRGVRVLGLHDLAAALRPVILPGESLEVHVLKEGKESGQGVAYLDDGTMVVVDDGRRRIGQTIDVTVTSLLKTSAGTMFFARETGAAGGRMRHGRGLGG